MNPHYAPAARHSRLYTGDFRCLHCRQIISADPLLSGVQNRNHCPYCLWSRHLDLARAGDRLSACKGPMQPVGLTIKRSARRYGPPDSGELMVIHRCVECDRLAINRIAADDIAETLYQIYADSRKMAPFIRRQLADKGIQALRAADLNVVTARLFGAN